MGKTYFVSGIDTSVGKTAATGLMARYLVRVGVRAITCKPVQTGNTGFSEDIDAHRAVSGTGAMPEDAQGITAPQIFAFPSSPELSARLEGKTVDVAKMAAAVETLADRYDFVLVEGAGGLAVPLSQNLLTIDWVAQKRWPLILVSSPRLGSLNHTILSLEAALSRGIPVAGVVYNLFPETDAKIVDDTRAWIRKYLSQSGTGAPVVDVPPFGSTVPDVDFGRIFFK